jgi:hypothetical protein
VTGEHLRAFLWLRWRLLLHQLRRAGAVNAVLVVVVAVFALLLAAGTFAGSLLVGLLGLAGSSPLMVLLVWDWVVVKLLMCWTLGVVIELQRSELFSLEKFLHLPVSLRSLFALNYLSSLLSWTLLVFVPGMVGLTLGLVLVRGPVMLLLLPLELAFLLALTALTYQFQGWLAALMANPRRRRAVVVTVTMGLLLVFQVPYLMVNLNPWVSTHRGLVARQFAEEEDLHRSLAAGVISESEYHRRLAESLRDADARVQEANRRLLEELEHGARLGNLAFPPGWLPTGAAALAEGHPGPALLGTLGLGLIGTLSLWRAYRTTLRLYSGQVGGQTPTSAPDTGADAPVSRLLEKRLPGIPEQAAVVALAGLRSLLRAPESRLMLLAPVVLLLLFGAMLWANPVGVPPALRPLAAGGVMAVALLNMVKVAGNQFGFDRGGFRVFVLCPARRRDVLLGKDLALAPFALGLALAVAGLFQAVCPMPLPDCLALLPQLLSMYLLFCLAGNSLSILAPLAIAPGSFRPVEVQVVPALLHAAFFFVLPLALAPTLIPLGVARLIEALGWLPGVPVCLILSLVECVAVVYLYRLVLGWQGAWLHAREQRILEVVTSKAE